MLLRAISLAQPDNDFCVDAQSIQCNNTIFGTTKGATIKDNNVSPSVWYTFTAENKSYLLTKEVSQMAILVYSGACNNLKYIGIADIKESVTFLGQSNQTYFIEVRSAEEYFQEIDFSFRLDCSDVTPNAFCDGAIDLICNQTIESSTKQAGFIQSECNANSSHYPGVWFKLIGDGQLHIIDLPKPTPFISGQVVVYLNCLDSLYCIDSGPYGTLKFYSELNQVYYFYVFFINAQYGTDFSIGLQCIDIPNNTNCENPKVVQYGELVSDTLYDSAADKERWYSFIGDGSLLSLDLVAKNNSEEYLKFTVFEENECNNIVEQISGGYYNSGNRLNFLTQINVPYYIKAYMSYYIPKSNFQFQLHSINPLINDNCETAIELSIDTPSSIHSSNLMLASPDQHCQEWNRNSGIWFKIIGNDTYVTISAQLHEFTGTYFLSSVFEGNCNELICVSKDFNDISFPAYKDQEYYILISSNNDVNSGDFKLLVETDFFCNPNLKDITLNNQIITLNNYNAKAITSNSLISAPSQVTFTASKLIHLSPNFKVEKGGTFHAYIETCVEDTSASFNSVPVSSKDVSLPNFKNTITLAPSSLTIFPNPTNGQTLFNFQLSVPQTIQLYLFNAQGQVVQVLQKKTLFSADQHTLSINMAAFPAGLYFVQLQGNKSVTTKRLGCGFNLM